MPKFCDFVALKSSSFLSRSLQILVAQVSGQGQKTTIWIDFGQRGASDGLSSAMASPTGRQRMRPWLDLGFFSVVAYAIAVRAPDVALSSPKQPIARPHYHRWARRASPSKTRAGSTAEPGETM